jgi:cysteine desulfurase/selenocysteine lyase
MTPPSATSARSTTSAPATRTAFDVQKVRRDFPILSERVHGKPLVYLDSANTSQKPLAVIEAMDAYYRHDNANIHRATHLLSERATALYEGARAKSAAFINAPDPRTIVFTKGTTDGINLVAQSYGRPRLEAGDEIVISWLEHHSNIVPWQLVAEATGAIIRVIPVDEAGNLDLAQFHALLGSRTRIVALTQLSNVLGTINPIRRIADQVHAVGGVLVVDGAQSAPHMGVDVEQLGCDFFACSGHKMLGPTGIGVLYGRRALLDAMPPYQGGGGMIGSVSFERTTYAPVPGRFEAGTPHIAGAIGMAAAVRYLQSVGPAAAHQHESELLSLAVSELQAVPGVRLIGAGPGERASVVSFIVEGVHPHDAGTVLDQNGVAVRGGHHCAQPLMRRFGVAGTLRASFSLYNTTAEVHALVQGLHRVREVFA